MKNRLKRLKKLYRLISKIYIINVLVRVVFKRVIKFCLKTPRIILSYWSVSGNFNIFINGVKIKLFSEGNDALSNKLYYGYKWEHTEFLLVDAILKKSKIFFDVGGNIGLYSLFAKLRNENLEVVCFEPNPINLKRIATNIELNKLTNQIILEELALSDSKGFLKFYVPKGDRISDVSSVYKSHTNNFYDIGIDEISVSSIKLDEYCSQKSSIPDFIKIDVELHEFEVLKGADKIISSLNSPHMLIEIFNDNIKTSHNKDLEKEIQADLTLKIENYLKKRNFKFYILGENGILKVDNLRSSLINSMYLITKVNSVKTFYLVKEFDLFALELYN